jgi:hypothetical protein
VFPRKGCGYVENQVSPEPQAQPKAFFFAKPVAEELNGFFAEPFAKIGWEETQ